MKLEIPTFDMEGPSTQILPNPGEAVVQCSKCAGRAFQIHVMTSSRNGADAQMTEMVCLGCGHTSKNPRPWQIKGIQ